MERVKNGLPGVRSLLAKARRFGFKDVLLGEVKVPRIDENYDMESEEGKKLTIAADMNELAYT
jgi:predicted Fe-Mo cluster-binding NifX family protein